MSEKKKNPVGRPNTTAQEQTERNETAKKYVFGGWQDVGDVVPSIAGLACFMGVTRETIYAWRDKDSAFSDILNSVMALQERGLINGGLAGGFNGPVTKMMLTKHGYSDKIEQDNKSSDGSMTPKAPAYKIVNE